MLEIEAKDHGYTEEHLNKLKEKGYKMTAIYKDGSCFLDNLEDTEAGLYTYEQVMKLIEEEKEDPINNLSILPTFVKNFGVEEIVKKRFPFFESELLAACFQIYLC